MQVIEQIAAGQASAEPANFDENVRNLITGQTPLYRARRVSLSPALLNAEDDNTFAAIMAPAYAEDDLYFEDEVQEMVEILEGLIPGVHVVVKPYVRLTEEEERDLGNDDTVRGQTMFAYDADADVMNAMAAGVGGQQ
ncbi:hypothetical protein CBER1_09420 [Cercospora berteroae]|uniref:Uncharacterized protein n=1 Tax=Cercospora berteroae TaxID=357750 RepID=A0A2S6CE17_9PEZI|nr:hypothetical protein CBER1_09420 [Cercospora berteroae]